ncbi:hypothetical protein J6590_018188 [Homalodisca vitripennis]|nr:hypothetical protein J6590_018188 [Homalodisca vitripennis]
MPSAQNVNVLSLNVECHRCNSQSEVGKEMQNRTLSTHSVQPSVRGHFLWRYSFARFRCQSVYTSSASVRTGVQITVINENLRRVVVVSAPSAQLTKWISRGEFVLTSHLPVDSILRLHTLAVVVSASSAQLTEWISRGEFVLISHLPVDSILRLHTLAVVVSASSAQLTEWISRGEFVLTSHLPVDLILRLHTPAVVVSAPSARCGAVAKCRAEYITAACAVHSRLRMQITLACLPLWLQR